LEILQVEQKDVLHPCMHSNICPFLPTLSEQDSHFAEAVWPIRHFELFGSICFGGMVADVVKISSLRLCNDFFTKVV